jgi:hypothetical protein
MVLSEAEPLLPDWAKETLEHGALLIVLSEFEPAPPTAWRPKRHFNTEVTAGTEASRASTGLTCTWLAMRLMPSLKRATWKLMRSPVDSLLKRRYDRSWA